LNTELSVIIPALNELENVSPMLAALEKSLHGIAWEVIFVDDDSPDDTATYVRKLAQEDARVRCIQRINRRGLASACVEGMLACASPYMVILDADMQHDEKIIPEMLANLKEDDVDLVIGSRNMEGGSMGVLASHRVWISRTATLLSRLALKHPVNDPMSGFFMLRRTFFEKIMRQLSAKGFKILLDILVTAGSSVNFREQPYIMRERHHGESKLSAVVIWEFLSLVAFKILGRVFPARFISFAAVGLSGVLVHLIALGIFHRIMEFEFILAQAAATLIAMTSNYILNNHFTFHDRRLRGKDFFKGLISFYLACSLGAVINVAVAEMLFSKTVPWWLAGSIGAVVGAVWNYATTTTFTWKEKRGETSP
jgi:dolichol-phosphate mannosyltransferase